MRITIDYSHDLDVNEKYSQDVWIWGKTFEALLTEANADLEIESRGCFPNSAVAGIDES